MRSTKQNALEIWEGGAVNPTAIANALVKAIAEARETAGTVATEAVYAPARLMVAQLASLMQIGIGTVLDGDLEYCKGTE